MRSIKPVMRACRTCKFWGEPSSKKARADYAFQCHAPIDRADWPESVSDTIIRKRPMCRDEGTKCPAWEIIV